MSCRHYCHIDGVWKIEHCVQLLVDTDVYNIEMYNISIVFELNYWIIIIKIFKQIKYFQVFCLFYTLLINNNPVIFNV